MSSFEICNVWIILELLMLLVFLARGMIHSKSFNPLEVLEKYMHDLPGIMIASTLGVYPMIATLAFYLLHMHEF